jgi:hypothetical protein
MMKPVISEKIIIEKVEVIREVPVEVINIVEVEKIVEKVVINDREIIKEIPAPYPVYEYKEIEKPVYITEYKEIERIVEKPVYT